MTTNRQYARHFERMAQIYEAAAHFAFLAHMAKTEEDKEYAMNVWHESFTRYGDKFAEIVEDVKLT